MKEQSYSITKIYPNLILHPLDCGENAQALKIQDADVPSQYRLN